jgi:hypothetical protein
LFEQKRVKFKNKQAKLRKRKVRSGREKRTKIEVRRRKEGCQR